MELMLVATRVEACHGLYRVLTDTRLVVHLLWRPDRRIAGLQAPAGRPLR